MKRSQAVAAIKTGVQAGIKSAEAHLTYAAAAGVAAAAAVEQQRVKEARQVKAMASDPRIKQALTVVQLEERRKTLNPESMHASHRAGELLRDALASRGY